MAVTVTNISYPSTSTGYLVFDAYVVGATSTPTVDITLFLALVTAGEEDAVYRDGAFRGAYTARSSVTGVGTIASPFHFSIRPLHDWPKASSFQFTPRFTESTATGLEPAGWESNYCYRQFQDFTDDYLANLLASATERARYPNSNMNVQCMVQDTDATRLAGLDASIVAANLLSPVMPIYPGIRLMPSTSATMTTWCTLSYWQTMAAKVQILLDRRQTGDPRIALDAESYGSSGSGGTNDEPSPRTLVAAGFTVAQFETAIQPLIDVLVGASPQPVVITYPHVAMADSLDLSSMTKRLLDTLGPTRVHVCWEDSFGATEYYRLDPLLTWTVVMRNMRQDEGNFERYYGTYGLKHRHVIDDDVFRAWGRPFFNYVENSFGPLRGWVVDETKMDRVSYGSNAGYVGTTVSSVNDVDYCWPFAPQPYASGITNPLSCGKQTSIALPQFRGSASVQVAGSCSRVDLSGLRLIRTVTNPYGAIRVSALPTSVVGTWPNGANQWTIDHSFQIPATLAASVPLFSQAFSNFATWQVYYDSTADAIKWVLRSGATTATQTLLTTPSRDTTIRIQLSRAGTDTWRWCVNGGAVTTFSVGATVSDNTTLIIGGGQTVATFGAGNNCESCDDYLCVGQLLVWGRALLTTGSPTEFTKINSGQFPINRTADSGTP